jgi:multidrug efflux pump subunit AcrB
LLDKELLPPEDRGQIRIFATGPNGVGVPYMERQTRRIEDKLQPLVAGGELQSVFTVVGMWDPNRSMLTVPMVDWRERDRSQQEVVAQLRAEMNDIAGARIFVGGSNSLNLRRGGESLRVALLGNDYEEIFSAAKLFAARLENTSTQLSQPQFSYEPTQPQLSIEIDRRRAADLGIDLDNLAQTLRAMIDGDKILDLNVGDESIPLVLESATGEINDPTDLVNLYVSARNGKLLPLSSIVSVKEEGVAAELDRLAQRRAIVVSVDMAPGYPMQAAVDELHAIAAESLPAGIDMLLTGEAATLNETSQEVALTYIVAVVVVFLILCAQFEGFSSAIVVTLIIPFGIAAAIFALYFSGTSVNIYSQIGLVMLIGLMAKNGILLVEFADQLRDQGYSLHAAITEGARVRLRPVAMTLISTVLGGLPLVLASGAGAEARESIGWVIFGGLGIAAGFTLFLTPALYLLLGRFSSARAHEAERLEEEMDAALQ